MQTSFTYKNIFISITLLLAISLAVWTTLLSFPKQANAPIQTNELPDASMENVTAIMMDKLGRPKMKIVTPQLIHYQNGDRTDFISPQITLYRKSPKPWVITANYGKATQGTDNVNFWDNVIIHHAADGNNPATIIKTATLLIHPNTQIAETTDSITLIQPSTIIRGIGMYADMNTGDIKLLSEAQGEYTPES